MRVSSKTLESVAGIVIGGSAGGVEALSVILPALPADLRCPVFVVMHLLREQPSLLVQIFSRLCAVSVFEAHDKEPALPASVYFAPPDYHMLVERGPQIALSVDVPVNYSRPSIDVLFESAADVFGEQALGILLSGANTDGTDGLAAVQGAGGATIVQLPDTAQSPIMVTSALKRTPVDFVLAPKEIAALLRTLGGSKSAQPSQIPED